MGVALVTGGTGCLGSALVRLLLASGANVRVLSRSPERCQAMGNDGRFAMCRGSLSDTEALKRACDGAEVVYHLAAKVHALPRDDHDADDFFVTNTQGTANLLSAASSASVRRVVFFSTVAVYGETPQLPADETIAADPQSPYARSKYEAEALVHSADKVEGVVLRLPVAYGPRDRGNVGKLIQAVDKRRFFLVSGPPNKRSLVGADNVANAALLAGHSALAAGQVFLVTDADAVALGEIVDAIIAALGSDRRPPVIPTQLARLAAGVGTVCGALLHRKMVFDLDAYDKLYGNLYFSSAKAQSELGYQPVKTLCQGIADEVNWMRSEGLLSVKPVS